MQSYPLNLLAGGAPTTFNTDANLFVYESGAPTPFSGDARIKVKPDNGQEIVLRPGQRFRNPGPRAQRWTVAAFDGATAIAGAIIIGSGEFGDANAASAVTILGASVPNAQALYVQKQALATISNIAPATIGTGAAQALISDPTLRVLRIKNSSASATLYLGATGVTAANAALALGPGDMWIEEDAAGAAWFATSDTAATVVQMQGLKL